MDARSSARDGGASGLPAADPVDHDRVRGQARGVEVAVGIGDREVIAVLRLAQVLYFRLLGRDLGTVGLAAGFGFVRCLAGAGHWPASLSAAVPDGRAGRAGSAWPW
jgi:hypothetical protein